MPAFTREETERRVREAVDEIGRRCNAAVTATGPVIWSDAQKMTTVEEAQAHVRKLASTTVEKWADFEARLTMLQGVLGAVHHIAGGEGERDKALDFYAHYETHLAHVRRGLAIIIAAAGFEIREADP